MGTGPDGTTYQLGEMAGTEQETLTVQQIPNHSHPDVASLSQGASQRCRRQRARGRDERPGGPQFYGTDSVAAMNTEAIAPAGGSQPHENMQPFLCINFIISLFGVFPSQT